MYGVPFSIICTSHGTLELRITQLHASVAECRPIPQKMCKRCVGVHVIMTQYVETRRRITTLRRDMAGIQEFWKIILITIKYKLRNNRKYQNRKKNDKLKDSEREREKRERERRERG